VGQIKAAINNTPKPVKAQLDKPEETIVDKTNQLANRVATNSISAVPLYTRTFRVDPNTFLQGLARATSATNSSAGGETVNEKTNSISGYNSALARAYFNSIGINLATNDGKFVFFNDRAGAILVRATAEDLAKIEIAIEPLTEVPPQVQLDVKFAQITAANYQSLGLDLPKPNPISTNNYNSFLSNGDASLLLSSTNPFTVVGILHHSQYRKIIDTISHLDGSDLLSCPKVTTESARQAHLEVSSAVEWVTNRAAVSSVPKRDYGYSTGPSPFTPTVDVLPTVSANGYLVETTVMPTTAEFVGYDPNPYVAATNSASGSQNGIPITAVLPVPRYRIRQSVISTNIFDGDTLVLCASLPTYGTNIQINQLIFVTPRIVDPAGNPVHTDEQMPLVKTPPKPESGNPR
jgi:type II secretory pathway component GspD/PulD (secretin)